MSENTPLKPCPNRECRSEELGNERIDYLLVAVVCKRCGFTGPPGRLPDPFICSETLLYAMNEAHQLWNDIPRDGDQDRNEATRTEAPSSRAERLGRIAYEASNQRWAEMHPGWSAVPWDRLDDKTKVAARSAARAVDDAAREETPSSAYLIGVAWGLRDGCPGPERFWEHGDDFQRGFDDGRKIKADMPPANAGPGEATKRVLQTLAEWRSIMRQGDGIPSDDYAMFLFDGSATFADVAAALRECGLEVE